MKVFKPLFRFFPVFLLTILVFVFFLPLFWPVPQIFATPDQFLSDILHFYYPTKFLLSQSLMHNQIPMWTDLIGSGFPLLGEGDIHALSLINIILFKFFPFITAFNLQYIIIFLGLSIGMYLVACEFGWSKLTAIFCAIIYAFSGLHIVKIFHLNCLQALFYVPFIFWIMLRMQKNKKTKLWLLLPFLISQQTLQGHYQYVFMSLIFLGLYGFLTWWIPHKEDRPWILKKILIIGFLTLGLAAIQLFPSFEYFIKTGGRADLAQNPIGSLTLNHLLQFFSPYILGDVRIGSYPAAQYGVGFHETFSYIGLIPILLALFSLFFIRKNTWVRNLWILIGILLLLAFEKKSPIYFLFSFPPFSWFRVYSRFLAFITFLLVLLSGFGFHKIEKKIGKNHIIILFLFFVSIFDVLSFATSYHVTLPAADFQKKPDLFPELNSSTRIMPFPMSNVTWYSYMSKNGWKNPKDYLYLLNSGHPDYTILHGISNLSVYAGALPKKQQLLLSLCLETSSVAEKTKTATLSALSIHTLQLHNTGILISPYQITNQEATLVKKTHPKNDALSSLYVFSLSGVKPQYYLTARYKKVQFIDEYRQEAGKIDALDRYDAFITTDRTLEPSEKQGSVSIISDVQTKKTFSITAPTDTFFIASLYFYPGWVAYLDGEKTDIDPANVSGMAVLVPKGTHTLTLQFIPLSFYLGLSVGGVTLLCYLFIILRSFRRI